MIICMNEEEKAVLKAVIESVVGDYVYKAGSARAIEFTEERLREIGMLLAGEKDRKVISQVTGRIKSADSIYKKIRRKNYPADRSGVLRCNDLLGVRMVCLFVDDVYEVAERLKNQTDIHILKEKDYIRKPKSNGYMSLHLIIEVPVSLREDKQGDSDKVREDEEIQWRKVEVQLRTAAMDFWSVLDHQLVYKKEFPGAESVGKELKEYAATIWELDKNMLQLRKKIEHLNI
ncbi:MAG: hypothetical protein J6K58_15710 [Lachnospiraceae bacterium]|nr:hypothetical protein [Lachnospiraceae bacterium]